MKVHLGDEVRDLARRRVLNSLVKLTENKKMSGWFIFLLWLFKQI